jgi:hypothetical protein
MQRWLLKINSWLGNLQNTLELRRRQLQVSEFHKEDEVLITGDRSKSFPGVGVVVARTPDYHLIVRFPDGSAMFNPSEILPLKR